MRKTEDQTRRETFPIHLIQPSHYDDDGYVIQWVRSEIPSNSMAMVYGIMLDCAKRNVLGPSVDIELTACDETNTRVRPDKIISAFRASGGKGMVAMVGVQSNQFPRAMDIVRPLRAAGIPVCLGGFHISGCLAMLPDTPPEIKEAQELGVSLFAGEAELGRMDEVIQHAYNGTLKPLYNYMSDLPGLEGATIPILPPETLDKNIDRYSSFDSGRGCPFQCSFCTIINVQGRKSRYRTADDIEHILQRNLDQDITHFFITDDNFARNKNWEAIFDRIIEFRERNKIKVKLIIQVDTLCHLIPNFIKKAKRAGVKRVFIGLENINPDNLLAAKKKQNRITEYRTMLQQWKQANIVTYAGYILGFPGDTPERILADIEIIKRELPVDLLEFFCLTPLPGSEDHKNLYLNGVAMEPDLNNYDLEHVCTAHPKMTAQEWKGVYRQAWETFYSPEHFETILRRTASKGRRMAILKTLVWFYGCQKLERVHPLQGGLFRRKYRLDRRPGLPRENPLIFYPRFAWQFSSKLIRLLLLMRKFKAIHARVENDPKRDQYMDLAMTPVAEENEAEIEMYRASDAAIAAVEKARKNRTRRIVSTAAE